MSKLIVEMEMEMEMPKNCSECPLKMDEQTCFNGRGIFGIEVQRMSWCPIKGVLPDKHGRLIDADDVNNHVQVVRCRECKHHDVFKNGVNGWCNKHECPTDVTYFCADGERRTE